MRHPTQMANANSSDAKNIKIPATINAAIFNPAKTRIVIANVMTKPSLAANIFGALSMALLPNFRVFVNQ